MSKKKKKVVDDDDDVGFFDDDDNDVKPSSKESGSDGEQDGAQDNEDEIEAEEARLAEEERALETAGLTQLEREAKQYEIGERKRELQERRAARAKESRKSSSSRGHKRKREMTKDEALKDLLERKSKKMKTSRSDELELGDEPVAESDEESKKAKRKSKSKSKKKSRGSDDEAGEERSVSAAFEDEDVEMEDAAENARLAALRPVGLKDSKTPLRLSDLISIQLRRTHLERLCEEPYFDEYVKGKYVRISIGENRSGQVSYRVCEVVGVIPSKVKYKFGVRKDYARALEVVHGKAKRGFNMVLVSNHSFSQVELDQWTAEMKRCGLPVLTAEEALFRKKEAEFKRANFVYTPEIVAQQLERKQQLNGLKHANLALQRIKLTQQRDDAKDRNDQPAIDHFTRKLDELENTQSKVRRTTSKLNSSIIAINDKNQRLTLQEIDKAAKLERIARTASQGQTEEKEADPFSRRRTLPTLGLDEEEAAAAAAGKLTAAAAAAAAPVAGGAAAAAKPAASAPATAAPSSAAPRSDAVSSLSLSVGSEAKVKPSSAEPFSLVASGPHFSTVFPAVRTAPSPSDKAWDSLCRQHDFELSLDLAAQPQKRPVALLPDRPPQNARILTLGSYWAQRADIS